MKKTLSASLYEDDNPNESRGDRVEIKDGLVTFGSTNFQGSSVIIIWKYDVYCG